MANRKYETITYLQEQHVLQQDEPKARDRRAADVVKTDAVESLDGVRIATGARRKHRKRYQGYPDDRAQHPS